MTNLIQLPRASDKPLDQLSAADCAETYTRRLEVADDLFLVSYLPSLQRVVFTSLREGPAGEFNLQFGPIASKTPADFILKNELKAHLETIK